MLYFHGAKFISFVGNCYSDVVFYQVNASSVDNCSFIGNPGSSGDIYAIDDVGTQTGNIYLNDYFNGIQQTVFKVSPSGPLIMHSTFTAPAQ
jgi:hypothetical protein